MAGKTTALSATWDEVWLLDGVRLAVTAAREFKRSAKHYGIASACIGGGQRIALLIENPGAA